MNRREELLTGGGEEVGDGGAEGRSALGDAGQAVTSLTADADSIGSVPCWNRMCARIFETSHLEGSYTGDLLQSLLQASLLGLERTAFSASSHPLPSVSVRVLVSPYLMRTPA